MPPTYGDTSRGRQTHTDTERQTDSHAARTCLMNDTVLSRLREVQGILNKMKPQFDDRSACHRL